MVFYKEYKNIYKSVKIINKLLMIRSFNASLSNIRLDSQDYYPKFIKLLI